MTLEARLAIRRMLVERGLVGAWAREIARRRGWRGSERDAHTRALHMLGDYGAHRALDIDDVLLAIELCGEDPGLGEMVAEAATRGRAAALERELEELRARRPAMRPVRPGERRLRDAG